MIYSHTIHSTHQRVYIYSLNIVLRFELSVVLTGEVINALIAKMSVV